MRYFELTMSKQVKHPIQPVPFFLKEKKKHFLELDEVTAGYYKYTGKEEVTDVLLSPFFMVKEEMMYLLQEKKIPVDHKAFQMFTKNIEDPRPLLYYCVYPEAVDCLHESVRIDPNGDIRELIIDQDKVTELDMFRIDQPDCFRIIITERLAELILTHHFYGYELHAVTVK